MSFVAAIKFITFLESLLLGAIVLRRAPRDSVSLLFAAYCLCIAASSLVEFQLVSAAVAAQFLFWKQFDTFMYLATAVMFHFSLRLTGWKFVATNAFKAVLYGATAVVMVLEGFVFRPDAIQPGPWSFSSIYGENVLNIHAGFIMAGAVLACAVVVILFLCMRRATAHRAKNRLKILFITTAALVACGVGAEVSVALTDRTALPLSITATSAYFLLNPVLAFAILRYNMLSLMPEAVAEDVLLTMSDAVALVEPAGIIEYVNRSFCSLTGMPAERLIGKHFDQIHMRCFTAQEGNLDFAVLNRSRNGAAERECLIEGEHGRLTPVSLSCVPIQRRGRPAGGFILTLQNISERKRLEELRLGAERIMRHDLRNALNGILGFGSLLSLDQSLDPEQRENARLIEQSAQLMTEQIDAYLYLQAIERGAFHPQMADVDLIALARHAMEMLSSFAGGQNVRYQLLWNNKPVKREDSCMVSGIKALLSGMMINLIKNALEAAPFGSMVTVRIDRGERVVFSVHNFGVIPAEIRPRLFTQYATYGKKKGSGLGTYSARLIAEALGGTIGFTTSDEQGTTVRVEFPSPEKKAA
jgi:PAS domain S-box-containing protein